MEHPEILIPIIEEEEEEMDKELQRYYMMGPYNTLTEDGGDAVK